VPDFLELRSDQVLDWLFDESHGVTNREHSWIVRPEIN